MNKSPTLAAAFRAARPLQHAQVVPAARAFDLELNAPPIRLPAAKQGVDIRGRTRHAHTTLST